MNNIDKRLAQAVVLLNRQHLLTNHLIDTWSPVLQEFEHAIRENLQTLNHVLAVYNYVFGLIDHLVRYQKIALVLPRLNQRWAEYRKFVHAMGDLKEIRNQLQHIQNHIENEESGPLLGAVFWISGQRQFMASLNDIGRKRSSPGLILDTHTGRYTQEFCYVYNDKYHDLGKAIEGMRAFNRFVNSNITVELEGKPINQNDHFAALCITVQISPQDPTKAST